MKKILAILLALLMLFSLCACSAMKEASEDEEEEKTTKPESEFSLGTIDDLNYESEYIGIGCDLPDNWRFYSDTELESLNGFVLDRLDGDARDMVENASIIYDMYAIDDGGANSININLEKVSKSQLKNIDIKQNMETLIPTLVGVYESVGYTDITSTVDTVTVDGEEFYCIRTTALLYGEDIYMVQLQIPCTEHMAAITIVSFFEDETQDYLDYFYLLD